MESPIGRSTTKLTAYFDPQILILFISKFLSILGQKGPDAVDQDPNPPPPNYNKQLSDKHLFDVGSA
jgi:hypothetical protein